MTSSKLCLALALLCASSLLVVGCNKGPKKVHVTGTIMVGEETVDSGSITFKSTDGGPDDGCRIVDGKFEADVTTGEKTLMVTGTKIVGEFEADPALNPGVMVNKYEDFGPNVFKEDVRVTIEKNNQVLEIKYSGNGPSK